MATIGEICRREVVVTKGNASVAEAARLMQKHHVGSLVVVTGDNGGMRRPVGILTDRDMIMEVMASERNPHEVRVEEIMSARLTTARDTDGVHQTLQLMRYKGIRRLPIVNGNGDLIGIVTTDDLLRVLSYDIVTLAGIAVRELSQEAVERSAHYA